MYKIYLIIFIIICVLIISSLKKLKKENFAFTPVEEQALKSFVNELPPKLGMLDTIPTLKNTYVKIDDSKNYVDGINSTLSSRITELENRPIQTGDTNNSSAFFDTDVNDNYKYSDLTNQVYTLFPQSISNTSNYVKTLTDNNLLSGSDKNILSNSSAFFDTDVNDNYKYSDLTNQVYTLFPQSITNTSNYVKTLTDNNLLSGSDKGILSKASTFFDTEDVIINFSDLTNQVYTLFPESISNTSNYVKTLIDNNKSSEEDKDISVIGAGKNHSVFLMSDGKVMACGENTKGQLGDGTDVSKNIPVYVKTMQGNYNKYLIFPHSGGSETQTEYSVKFDEPDGTVCDILIVAGGGGGGMGIGGGGGGGGVIMLESQLITAGNYTVTVGKGGNGAPVAGINAGENGHNSSFNGNIAIGGGYGGSGSGQGNNGGSGGGGGGGGGGNSGVGSIHNINKTGTGVIGQGFRGGYGTNGAYSYYSNHYSGGGGGAGGIGGGPSTDAGGAKGGIGKISDILDVEYYWGGGGGGSGYSTTGGNGGKGGGGGGAVGTTIGGDGYTNGSPGGGGNIKAKTPGGNGGMHTGGGGGGGGFGSGGGGGGSGIVIIRYKKKRDNIEVVDPVVTAGGTITPIKIFEDLTNVKAVYAGGDHSIYLLNDGKVLAVGDNTYGQLGVGESQPLKYPMEILNEEDGVKSVSTGTYHTMILFKDGTVKACGKNTYGQLGDGTNTQRFSLVDVKLSEDVKLKNVKKISCSTFHTMFLLNDGTVMGCGNNNNGQLGDDTTLERLYPVFVKDANGNNMKNVKNIATGAYHTIFLKDNGNAYGCGLYFIENIENSNVPIVFAKKITNIYSGYFSIIYVKNYDTFMANGYNIKGHLLSLKKNDFILKPNILDLSDNSIFISIGYSHTLIYNSDHSVLSSGNNSKGQLGIDNRAYGNLENVILPVSNVSTTGTIDNNEIMRNTLSNSTNIKKIADIYGISLITILSNSYSNHLGQTFNIGQTDYQKIFNDIKPNIADIIAGSGYTIILFTDGSVHGIGTNTNGQFGIGNITSQKEIVPILGLKNIKKVYTNIGANTFAIDIDGNVYSCGNNNYGQLGIYSQGDNQLVPIKLDLKNVKKIASTHTHTLFLDENNNVYGCGSNQKGELGLADLSNILVPTKIKIFNNIKIVDIYCLNNGTIFLDSDGKLYGLGSGVPSSIGISSITNNYPFSNKIVKILNNGMFLDEKNNIYKINCTVSNCTNGTITQYNTYYRDNNIIIKDIFGSYILDIDGNVYTNNNNEKISALSNIGNISLSSTHAIFLKYEGLDDNFLNNSMNFKDTFANPTVDPYLLPSTINPSYKYFEFSTSKPNLVYDFTPYTNTHIWLKYAESIGATHNFDDSTETTVFNKTRNTDSYITIPLPYGYDYVSVEFGGEPNGTYLYTNNTQKQKAYDISNNNKYNGYFTPNGTLQIKSSKIANDISYINKRLIITFSSTIKTSDSYTINFPKSTECDILIVGGGGGGGGNHASGHNDIVFHGGGGAGEFQFLEKINLEGEYTIDIGEGGDISTDGSDSKITKNGETLYISKGGGKGADNFDPAGEGGSGGGGKYDTLGFTSYGIAKNGNNGAPGTNDRGVTFYGGGGGGTGGPGISKDGGLGISNNITGSTIYYAGGGGGGVGKITNQTSINGIGGSGIGGNGAVLSDLIPTVAIPFKNASNGAINTGSGGGGGSAISSTGRKTAGKGGSGIVIIRYKIPNMETTGKNDYLKAYNEAVKTYDAAKITHDAAKIKYDEELTVPKHNSTCLKRHASTEMETYDDFTYDMVPENCTVKSEYYPTGYTLSCTRLKRGALYYAPCEKSGPDPAIIDPLYAEFGDAKNKMDSAKEAINIAKNVMDAYNDSI